MQSEDARTRSQVYIVVTREVGLEKGFGLDDIHLTVRLLETALTTKQINVLVNYYFCDLHIPIVEPECNVCLDLLCNQLLSDL